MTTPSPDGYEIITTRRGGVRHLRHIGWGLRTACGRIVAPEQVTVRDAPGTITAGCGNCAKSHRGQMATAVLTPLGRAPFPSE